VKLLPGEQMTGKIRLSVPIDEWNAYDLPDPSAPADLVTVEHVVLAIDVIPQSKVQRIQQAKTPSEHWWVVGQETRVTCRVDSKVPITLRRRRDSFPRS
jgi:hypothetical protein